MAVAVKYRPSSHSEDYVLIATYKDSKAAACGLKRLKARLERLHKAELSNPEKCGLDWAVSAAHFYRERNRVVFQVYSSSSPQPIEQFFESDAEDLEVRVGEQALHIAVELPKGVNLETAPLLLGADEVTALKLLVKIAGKPKVKKSGCVQVWEWHYLGELYYLRSLNELFYGDDFVFRIPCNWKVRLKGTTLKGGECGGDGC